MSVEKLWGEGEARLEVVRLWLKLGSSTSCSSRSEPHYSEGTDARDDTGCQDQRFRRIWPGGSVESRPGGSVGIRGSQRRSAFLFVKFPSIRFIIFNFYCLH